MFIENHKELLVDNKVHEKKIGESVNLRQPHLNDLKELEQKIRNLCPLEYCTYDVVRFSKPYFREFSYTEMMGGLLVTPTSSEIAIQTTSFAINNPVDELNPHIQDFFGERIEKQGGLDKYKLNQEISKKNVKKIVFLPGSNIFGELVSKENLARLLWEDSDVYVKFHPFTHEGTIRALCGDFGYERFIDPMESGWEYLFNAEEIWVTSATELGFYGVLFDKTVHNISNFFAEQKGAFYPIFKHVIGKEKEVAKENLLQLLSSPYSGFFMPNDPDVDSKIKLFYKKSMELREPHKPMIFESNNVQLVQREIQKEHRRE